ncbi:hypothetical protein HJG60_010723 [Phyllostomus discolor]|uniref:Uncharacterized protein n=1 Tax=Phyllostomus discolor TaxID=89673 RepID=A0A834ANP1_9CHIR|nr:hypothetical protein HJG60_010723 [Phyllostomus discolor]
MLQMPPIKASLTAKPHCLRGGTCAVFSQDASTWEVHVHPAASGNRPTPGWERERASSAERRAERPTTCTPPGGRAGDKLQHLGDRRRGLCVGYIYGDFSNALRSVCSHGFQCPRLGPCHESMSVVSFLYLGPSPQSILETASRASFLEAVWFCHSLGHSLGTRRSD